ncbi:MAG TPA: hypothetical protein PKW37_07830, partial [Salinivirgaceae bacterium]|nr:hypothetical protein [Salinivirgaceae bacterium]
IISKIHFAKLMVYRSDRHRRYEVASINSATGNGHWAKYFGFLIWLVPPYGWDCVLLHTHRLAPMVNHMLSYGQKTCANPKI